MSVCLLEFGTGHEQTSQGKWELTDNLGLSPNSQKKVVVQLQPQREQSQGPGMWQLETSFVQTKEMSRNNLCNCTLQVPAIWSPTFFGVFYDSGESAKS